MLSHRLTHSLAVVLLALAGPASGEGTGQLKPLASGAVSRMAPSSFKYRFIRLTSERPAGLVKSPELAAGLFGVFSFGTHESPSRVIVAVDEPEGQPARLYVDANANGDLTDDPAAEWKGQSQKRPSGEVVTSCEGGAFIRLMLGDKPVPAHLGMSRVFRSAKNHSSSNPPVQLLFFYTDYGYEGEIALGDVTYKAMLVDQYAMGDFRGTAGPFGSTEELKPGAVRPSGSGVELMIDVNKNGRFDSKGERFDVQKPFNIKGTTYEIAGLPASGAQFQIRKSDSSVAEILLVPDLSVGEKAIKFSSKTTDGQEVSFPSSFAGRLVLLNFWATWCVPCIEELPHLTKAYARFHDQGLEMLGVSLDLENGDEKVASFTKDRNMPWRQVYDGKSKQNEVAELYGVDGIPRAYLVDGDTGEILATGASLAGTQLEKTLVVKLGKKGLLKKAGE
jgi:peroxiredoxin